MTVFGILVFGLVPGIVGAFGAAGIDSVALSGFDSPLLFFKKMVRGNFFPDIEAVIGTSKMALLPTMSPLIASFLEMPKVEANRYASLARDFSSVPTDTVMTAEVPAMREEKFVGEDGTAVIATDGAV